MVVFYDVPCILTASINDSDDSSFFQRSCDNNKPQLIEIAGSGALDGLDSGRSYVIC